VPPLACYVLLPYGIACALPVRGPRPARRQALRRHTARRALYQVGAAPMVTRACHRRKGGISRGAAGAVSTKGGASTRIECWEQVGERACSHPLKAPTGGKGARETAGQPNSKVVALTCFELCVVPTTTRVAI